MKICHAVSEARQNGQKDEIHVLRVVHVRGDINYSTLFSHTKYCCETGLIGSHLVSTSYTVMQRSVHVTDFSTEYYVRIKWKLNFR